MTTQKSFKRRVRARMEKTGERYTAARAQLLPDPAPEYEPQYSDETVRSNTGRSYREWFADLDAWGAADRPHREIARWLSDEFGVPGWWCQNVTVEYERARGLRPVGGGRDGRLSAGASKTVAVAVERLFAAFADLDLREQWLPSAPLRQRTAKHGRSARYDWGDGSTRVIVAFDAKGEAKSTVTIAHERLPDRESAEEMKAYWRERLSVLKTLLEGD
jgi:hypothetical protein